MLKNIKNIQIYRFFDNVLEELTEIEFQFITKKFIFSIRYDQNLHSNKLLSSKIGHVQYVFKNFNELILADFISYIL